MRNVVLGGKGTYWIHFLLVAKVCFLCRTYSHLLYLRCLKYRGYLSQDKAHSALQRIKAQQVLTAAQYKRKPLHYPCTQPACCRRLSEQGSGAPGSLTPSLSPLSVQHTGAEQAFVWLSTHPLQQPTANNPERACMEHTTKVFFLQNVLSAPRDYG